MRAAESAAAGLAAHARLSRGSVAARGPPTPVAGDGDGGRQRGARHRPGRPTPRGPGADAPAAPRSIRCCAVTAWPTTRRWAWCTPPRAVFDPRRLRSLQPFSLERTLEGTLRFFEYEVDAEHLPARDAGRVRAARRGPPSGADPADARARRDGGPHRPRHAVALSGDGRRRRSGPSWPWTLAGIFSGEVDFNSELQPGDGFALAFERYTREGGAADLRRHHARPSSATTAACCARSGSRRPGGRPGYYDEAGRSLRRFFLRSPLKFEPRDHLAASRRAAATRCCTRRARIAASTTPRRSARRSIAAAGRRGGVGDPRRHQRPHGAAAARVGLRVALSAPSAFAPRHSRRRSRRRRATRSASSAPRAWRPARTCTTRSPRTACS